MLVTFLKKIIAVIDKILLVASIAGLFCIIASATLGIFSRKLFNRPFAWTEELCTFLFIMVSFFGAACCAYRRREIIVDYFIDKIPEKFIRPMNIVIKAMILAFIAMIIVGGVRLQPRMAISVSVALGIPRNYYYMPILISASAMFLIYAVDLIELLSPGHNTKEGTK